jgi:uncharacterized protein (DUF58 family)
MTKTAYVRRHMVRAGAALGSALLIAAASGGCEPPPNTSPVVSIVSPVQDQKLPAGKPIDVRFTVGGFDASGPTMVKFVLGSGSAKEFGRGKVRAFIGPSNYLAETNVLPNDANPFMVPNATIIDPAQIVTPGRKEIRLILFYNDEFNTRVDPQRQGTVTVTIE